MVSGHGYNTLLFEFMVKRCQIYGQIELQVWPKLLWPYEISWPCMCYLATTLYQPIMRIAPKSTSTSLWSKFCIFLSDWAFVFVKMTCGLAHPCQTSEPVPINILSLNRVTFACIIYFAVIFFLHKIIETKTNPSPFYVRKVKKPFMYIKLMLQIFEKYFCLCLLIENLKILFHF